MNQTQNHRRSEMAPHPSATQLLQERGLVVNPTPLFRCPGNESHQFHALCDHKGPTLTVVTTTGGHAMGCQSAVGCITHARFNGYTSVSWTSPPKEKCVQDPEAFVVDADGMLYNAVIGDGTVHNAEYGPAWGSRRTTTHLGEVIFTGSVRDNFRTSFVNGNSPYYRKGNLGFAQKYRRSLLTWVEGRENIQVTSIAVYSVVLLVPLPPPDPLLQRAANMPFWTTVQRPDLEAESAGVGGWASRNGVSYSGDVVPGSPLDMFVRSQMRCTAQLAVSRIVMVQSDVVEAFLTTHRSESKARQHTAILRPANPTDADSVAALAALMATFADAPGGHARILFAWYGARADLLEDICSGGPRSLRWTDPGFFGAGSYLGREANYAGRYARMGGPNAHGEYGVILYAVSVSRAVPLTLGLHYHAPGTDTRDPSLHGFSKFYSGDRLIAPALSPNCDAHFVPVRACGLTHPVDLSGPAPPPHPLLPHDVDFQACPEHLAEGHELVILNHRQCVPVAIVYFT